MDSFLRNLLKAMTSESTDLKNHALLQLAMLLERNHRPSEEEGFYESILPPEAQSIELSEREQKEILSEIAAKPQPPEVAASFLWAIGKASPNVGLPVLLDFLRNHPDVSTDPNACYQAVIALDNCLDESEIESLDKRAAVALREFLNATSASSDSKLAQHSSRLLKRLKPRKPRKIS